MIKHILFLICIAIWSFVGHSAMAAAPISKIVFAYGGVDYSDPSVLCTKVVALNWPTRNAVLNGLLCEARNSSTGGLTNTFDMSGLRNNRLSCADGSVPDTSVPTNMQCPDVLPPPDCAISSPQNINLTTAWATGASVGSAIAKKVIQDGKLATSTFCVERCAKAPSAGPNSCKQSQTAGANGYFKISCEVPMVNQGGQCSGTEAPGFDPSGKTEPSTKNGSENGACPAGSAPAGQDPSGMTICAGTKVPDNTPKLEVTGPAKTSTDADGNKVTTQDVVKGNADGTKTTTTTTTTTAPDGTSTTVKNSVTTTKPSGDAGTEDKPEDKTDICKQHPELTVCKNSQVLGTCGEISCTGDAIQCATLRAAAALECRDKQDRDDLSKSPLVALGDQVIAGNDPMAAQYKDALKGTSVDLGSSSLDQTGFVGGASCFADKTFSVRGRTVTMSFAKVCANIQPLRYAMLLIGFICAYLIVSKSVLQS